MIKWLFLVEKWGGGDFYKKKLLCERGQHVLNLGRKEQKPQIPCCFCSLLSPNGLIITVCEPKQHLLVLHGQHYKGTKCS